MGFSEFLESRRAPAKALAAELGKQFAYVSILGADVKSKAVQVTRNTSTISPGRDTECGFVVKIGGGSVFYEYSLDDISGDIPALAEKIAKAYELNAALLENTIGASELRDEPMVRSFARAHDLADWTDQQLLSFCKEQCAALLAKDEHFLNAMVSVGSVETSKLFITKNRELDQDYA